MFYLWRAMVGKPAVDRQEEQMAIANRVESVVGTKEDAGSKITRHAGLLSAQLQQLRTRMYPPKSEKTLRQFLTNEVSKLTSIPDSTLKLMSIEGRGPVPSRLENNHRVYTLAQINELRELFAKQKPAEALRFFPRRRAGEHLRFLPLPISRAVAQRPRPASTSLTTWLFKAIVFSRSTWTLRHPCQPCSAPSQR